MNLNDFSKWLQRVKNVRGSEYFPYPLYMCVYIRIYIWVYMCVYMYVCVTRSKNINKYI